MPASISDSRTPAWPPLRGRGVDRVAVRADLGVAEHLVEARLDARRDRPLEAHRLLVRLGPAEPDDARQQPLEQGVAAEDRVGRRRVPRSSAEARARRRARRARRRRAGGTSRWRPAWSRRGGGRSPRPSPVGHRSFPAVTRSASRYSWAAADRSRGSCRAGHGLRIRGRAAAGPPATCRTPSPTSQATMSRPPRTADRLPCPRDRRSR